MLRDQITHSLYAVGDMIPKEDELCRLLGVSRIHGAPGRVRPGAARLDREASRPGHVREGRSERLAARGPRPIATLGLIGSLSRHASDTEVRVLGVEHAVAPPVIALQLGLAVGERAVHASRLRSAQGVPMMVTEAWGPEHVGRHVTAATLKKRTLYEILMTEASSSTAPCKR